MHFEDQNDQIYKTITIFSPRRSRIRASPRPLHGDHAAEHQGLRGTGRQDLRLEGQHKRDEVQPI